MYLYKDVFSGDELFSDTYPIKLVDDVLFEVTGKHETRTEGEVQLDGANASAEGADADEGVDSNSVSGVDVILNHRLVETGFGSKKDYTVYLKDYMKKVVEYLEKNHRLVETGFGSKKDYTVYMKDYMKKVVEYLEKNDRAGEVDGFKKNINGVMKDLISRFKDLQFFTGESMEADAMILILDYKEVETKNGKEERPILMAFKHGLEIEKV